MTDVIIQHLITEQKVQSLNWARVSYPPKRDAQEP
jgi:hypothetical protein